MGSVGSPGTLGMAPLMGEVLEYTSSNIPDDLKKWCLKLITENMEFRHSKSATLPWSKKKKLAELEDPLTKFLIVQSEHLPVAFASYQITTEADVNDQQMPCLYIYELQVQKSQQGQGLGKFLLGILEEIARNDASCGGKIMLTGFKALPNNRLYKSPLDFYLKHGFQVDPISPSKVLPAKNAAFYDYEILSKVIL